MGWFKTDDQLAFHAKVVAAGNSAMGLWIRAGSWSSAQLTDGFIPTHMANAMANAMANPCDYDALVMAGLWDEVEGGYRFHDWEEFQPSADEERAKRKARSLAGKKGAAARWDGKPHSKSHGKTHANAMANGCDSDAPTRPDPTRPDREAKASLSNTAEEFMDWYIEYPRKASRAVAEKAYAKARKAATAEELLDGARRYAADPNREQEFTKLPATWLNGACWEDGPLPARNTTQPRATGSQARLQAGFDLLQQTRAETGQLELGA